MRLRFHSALPRLSWFDAGRRTFQEAVSRGLQANQNGSAGIEDLSRVAQGTLMRPSPHRMAADKALFLSKLKEAPVKRRFGMEPPPLVGALATAGLLIGVATGTNAATTGLPAPVDNVVTSVESFIGWGSPAALTEAEPDAQIWLGHPSR